MTDFRVQFVPFNDDWLKKSTFEESVFNFELSNVICVPCRVCSSKRRNMEIGLSKFHKSSVAFYTTAFFTETPSLALQNVFL